MRRECHRLMETPEGEMIETMVQVVDGTMICRALWSVGSAPHPSWVCFSKVIH